MTTHPKAGILPKPFSFSSFSSYNVEIFARRYIENGTFPPSVYYNEVLDYLRTNGYKEYAWRLSDEIKLEAIRAEKEINPLRAVKISSTKEKEKTIIPRAEDVYAVKASRIMKFNFIARILYLLASYRIKGDINYAIKHRASYIFLDDDDWKIRYFPELIDRLKYLGYRVNKNAFRFYIYWDNGNYPGEEI